MKKILKYTCTFFSILLLILAMNNIANAETDSKTGLEKPEDVWNKFVEDTKFIYDEDEKENYDAIASVIDCNAVKKEFLTLSENNTEEQWNELTLIEKFYIDEIVSLDVLLKNRTFKNKDDFLKEHDYYLRLYKSEKFYEHVLELEGWVYDYYMKTGKVYYFIGNDSNAVEKTDENINDKDIEMDQEYKEIKNELESELKQDSTKNEKVTVGSVLSKYKVGIIVLIIIGISVIAVTLYLKKKSDEIG